MTTNINNQKIESRARYMYLADTSNADIHCNRFPGWSELSETSKAEYYDRARRALEDEQ